MILKKHFRQSVDVFSCHSIILKVYPGEGWIVLKYIQALHDKNNTLGNRKYSCRLFQFRIPLSDYLKCEPNEKIELECKPLLLYSVWNEMHSSFDVRNFHIRSHIKILPEWGSVKSSNKVFLGIYIPAVLEYIPSSRNPWPCSRSCWDIYIAIWCRHQLNDVGGSDLVLRSTSGTCACTPETIHHLWFVWFFRPQ